MRGREVAPRSEVTATRLAVSRVCGLVSPDTPVPLETENGDTPGLIVASITSSGEEGKPDSLSKFASNAHKNWADGVTISLDLTPNFAIRTRWTNK